MSGLSTQPAPTTAKRRGRLPKTGRRATTGAEREIARQLRKDGLLPKVQRDLRAVCADHAAEHLGFPGAPWALVTYVDALAHEGGRLAKRGVRIPASKVPAFATGCTARPCPSCRGTGGIGQCRCSAFGWYFLFRMRKAREARAV